MKKVLIYIYTTGRINKKVLHAAMNQDYLNCQIMLSVMKPIKQSTKEAELCRHQNLCRNMILSNDADYFLNIEDDIVLPLSAVTEFMKQAEQDLTKTLEIKVPEGMKVYPIPKKEIQGGYYKYPFLNIYNAGLWVADHTASAMPAVVPSLTMVDWIGSGCMFISRKVMEQIPFSNDSVLGLCCCKGYSYDVQKAGYTLYMNGSVVCEHLQTFKSKIKNIKERILKCRQHIFPKDRINTVSIKSLSN